MNRDQEIKEHREQMVTAILIGIIFGTIIGLVTTSRFNPDYLHIGVFALIGAVVGIGGGLVQAYLAVRSPR